jgi:phosphoribosylformylglycinamidine synthase subunit PurL
VTATPGFDPLDPKGRPEAAPGEKQVCADIPVDALTEAAPIYDRPRTRAPVRADVPVPESTDPRADLVALLRSPNVGSRAWVWRQYDHIVRGGSVVRPGSDAAVVRVPCERDGRVVMKHLAFAVDCNARFVELAPESGAEMAIAEVCRNLVCAGAEPIGITDCLNFASPEDPVTMDAFARAVDGIAEACRALDVPIVSGNVSLYNETTEASGKRAILPTPTVAAVGLVRDPEDITRQWFEREGDVVLLLGAALEPGLGGSEYQALRAGALGGPAPRIDLAAEARLQSLILDLARARLLASAHDIADGGLFVALAECCATGPRPVGADVTIPVDGPVGVTPVAATLFGEAPTRIVVSARPDAAQEIEKRAAAAGVAARRLGTTRGEGGAAELRMKLQTKAQAGSGEVAIRVHEIASAREACLSPIVGDPTQT